MATCPDELRDRYLDRLGLDAEPPSVEALFRLHRAHVERVPWETLWIQMGERWGIDPVDSARRIADEGRGGYCFHLNGAFGLLLESLGYQVNRHVGGVHDPTGPSEDEMTNHLVLTVTDLPDAHNPGGTWYLDAGLGDALHDPLPLAPGTYHQGPHTYELAAGSGPAGDWRFVHHPGRGFAGMAWLAAPTTMDAFTERHTELSTSPQSPFVRWLVLQRRHAHGVDVLKGLTLTRTAPAESSVQIGDRDELVGTLDEVFGIDVRHRPIGELDALWERVNVADVAHRRAKEHAET
jgi:N-hydroxyarylamine O-acetyltransferase